MASVYTRHMESVCFCLVFFLTWCLQKQKYSQWKAILIFFISPPRRNFTLKLSVSVFISGVLLSRLLNEGRQEGIIMLTHDETRKNVCLNIIHLIIKIGGKLEARASPFQAQRIIITKNSLWKFESIIYTSHPVQTRLFNTTLARHDL